MTSKNNLSTELSELRQLAEKTARSPQEAGLLSSEETGRMLQELLVHQLELEMQNEELLRTKELLEAARERYFELYELAPVGYCTFSESGLILEANLTASTLLGMAKSTLVKQNVSTFIFGEDQDVFYLHSKQLFKSGNRQACELRMVRCDNTTFWAHMEATVAQADDGTIACRVIISDITERKQAEELRASEAHYRLLTEGVSDVVWKQDLENYFTYISPADERLRGYRADEVVGHHIFEQMTAEGIRVTKEKIHKRQEAEQRGIRTSLVSFEVQQRCKNGKRVWTEIFSTPERNADGIITGYHGITRDITERKIFEAKLLAEKHKLEKALQISDQYRAELQELNSRIKGVVEVEERSRLYRDLHDGAGQSLHAIGLHLKMLADGRGGYDDPKHIAAQLATEVAAVAAELRELAHQLRPTYLQEVPLDRALIQRCEMLGRRGVPINVSCSGDFTALPYTVNDNLYRIALEAMANASRHSGAREICLRLTRADNLLQLLIGDDGCGLKDQPHKEGGVGLHIMRERATLIGAEFNIDSSSSGTLISVKLEQI